MARFAERGQKSKLDSHDGYFLGLHAENFTKVTRRVLIVPSSKPSYSYREPVGRLSGRGQRSQELQLGLQSDPLLVNHLEPKTPPLITTTQQPSEEKVNIPKCTASTASCRQGSRALAGIQRT